MKVESLGQTRVGLLVSLVSVIVCSGKGSGEAIARNWYVKVKVA